MEDLFALASTSIPLLASVHRGECGRLVFLLVLFFHRVIAILLGVLEMTVENATKAFIEICKEIFAPDVEDEATRSDRLTLVFQRILDELEIPHNTRIEGDIEPSASCRMYARLVGKTPVS